MPRLEYLRLQQCSRSLTRSLSEIRLSHLTELHLRDFDLPSSAILFAWINQLPSLKFLVCDKMDCTPDAFCFLDTPFGNQQSSNLVSIKIQNCSITEDHLEKILFEVLPKFPTVARISFRNNNIRSFRPIVERLDRTKTNNNKLVALRYFDLLGNPIARSCKRDSREREALCLFLRAFSSIEVFNELSDLHRDIDCELLLNCAGRRLVEGRGKRQQ